jgi:chromosome segregation ATPase
MHQQDEIKELVAKWVSLDEERSKLEVQDNDLKAEVDQVRDKLYKMMETMGRYVVEAAGRHSVFSELSVGEDRGRP